MSERIGRTRTKKIAGRAARLVLAAFVVLFPRAAFAQTMSAYAVDELLSRLLGEAVARQELASLKSYAVRSVVVRTPSRQYQVISEDGSLRAVEGDAEFDPRRQLRDKSGRVKVFDFDSSRPASWRSSLESAPFEFIPVKEDSQNFAVARAAFLSAPEPAPRSVELEPGSHVFVRAQDLERARLVFKTPMESLRVVDLVPADDANNLLKSLGPSLIKVEQPTAASIAKRLAGARTSAVVGHIEGSSFVLKDGSKIDVQQLQAAIKASGSMPLILGCSSAGLCGVGPSSPITHRRTLEGLLKGLGAQPAKATVLDLAKAVSASTQVPIALGVPPDCPALLTNRVTFIVLVATAAAAAVMLPGADPKGTTQPRSGQ